MAIELQTFVVIAPHYFGKGGTIAEAVKNAKGAGWSKPRKKTEVTVIATDAPRDKVRVSGDVGVRVEAPKGATIVDFKVEV